MLSKNKEINQIILKKVVNNIQLCEENETHIEVNYDYSNDKLAEIAEHQKSPTTKPLIFFEFCGKYVPIQFRGLIFYGQLSKKR